MTTLADGNLPSPRRRIFGLPLRFALRELRGGLRGFYVFIACIALGVTAIAGVGSVAQSLADGLSREGRAILGGDVSFSLIQREANDKELAFVQSQGAMSVSATMRAMVKRGDGELALIELKAADGAYPLVGKAVTEPALPMAEILAERDGAFGAAADAALMARLNLKAGDRVTLGTAPIVIRAVLQSEPDRFGGGGAGFAPRVLTSEAALRASGLLQPGSQVRWAYRIVLREPSDRAAEAAVTAARAALPESGWQIRTRNNASPQLERNIERFTQFLTLVGLASLLVGGVGVANAVKSHLDRRRDVIATLKAVGGSGTDVFSIYLVQVMLLAAVGSAIGLAIGAAFPFAIKAAFGAIIPIPLEARLHASELALAFAYGLLTALTFALWPLGRVHDVPVSTLFREATAGQWRKPRRRYVVLLALSVTLLLATVIGLAYDRRIAAVFVVAAALTFVLLRVVATAVMAGVKRLPRPRSPMLRLALSNISRPGAITPSVVLSLGLGLALLVTVVEIDGNLRRQFTASLPEKAPSFFFIDIPASEAGRFDAFLRERAPDASLNRVPMLRGRIVSAGGVKAEDIDAAPDAQWVLESDRGITYADDIPNGSRVVEGAWWGPDYKGPPLVSFEKKLADGLGLKLGDEVVVNVLGRNVTATIANMRTVDWQSLGINFVLVFSPSAFRGAPHTHIATLSDDHSSAERDADLVRAVATAFPTVTAVRVREAVQSVAGLVTNLIVAIRGASAVTLISAMLVLGGALAAGHHARVYDAVILKTLGATRARLIGAYAIEYLLVGCAAAAFGVLAGSVSAWLVVTRLMNLGFQWEPAGPILVVILALCVTVALGLLGTLGALNQKPAPVLRNL